jgi:hypothetical protein
MKTYVMKAYVMTTGLLFGLLTVAHVWRVFEEGARLATDPWYVLIPIAAARSVFGLAPAPCSPATDAQGVGRTRGISGRRHAPG